MTPAPQTARRTTHARSTVAPRAPRRISGPVARRPVAVPGGLTTRGTTSVFARVRALPDHKLVDRLLRSRLWIWALAVALLGIVTMQVSLLKLNSGISRAVETSATFERANGELEAKIAQLSKTDRVQTGATALGMVMPAAGDVSYLTPRAGDAARAARRMTAPSDAAAALLANHGIVPGSLATPVQSAVEASAPDPATLTAAPATTTTTTPDPVATPIPTPAVQTTSTTTTQTTTTPAVPTVAGQG
jgi:hypothetical protein